ncbi:uncharacterized protein K452DRAFT_218580 [Aplosporella prunicola CBS 121167]|uniref:HMA domain-containing protein n=1 Tax=Aplosporella prunicola CBS 121167 TaxID=1176127 RepID=A0A6A6BV04_9PEZI|nr:uncharacterized protein K452DRAFT_218580 [Aplosporella prunicola CBS 121167]KAF2146637.1 hypothetical protein K452DRAFT_218580 [Aplosporella prunicola CBS 121167]
MSPRVGASTPQLQSSTIFISNLHCPSCVNSIVEALNKLDPAPVAVSHSIVSHSVTVRHHPELSNDTIAKALEFAGFEVHSIFQDSNALGTEQIASPVLPSGEWESSLEQAVHKWRQSWRESWRQSRMPDMQQMEKHLTCCAECAAGKDSSASKKRRTKTYDEKEIELDSVGLVTEAAKEHGDIEKQSIVSDAPSSLESIVVASPQAPQLYQASIAITGMTCSACTNAITRQVEELPYVRSIAVSLMTHSASVDFEGKDNVSNIIETIEDTGFDASLDNVKELSSPKKSVQQSDSDKWRAVFAVGGMTCSACTNSVTDALKQRDWIETVDVVLISNSATVVFDGKEHLDEIKEAIEDVGFEATLDIVENLEQERPEDVERLITIRIDNMFCQHCPTNIVNALERHFKGTVQIEKPPTFDDPLIELKYIPALPKLTIREIIATISDVHPTLSPSVYHPPTLEERAKQMHARERSRVLFRLGLSITVAIPTFIIGIVYMSLVSAENSTRMFLMADMWSGKVSRAQWALFVLATPVYFFAADSFHRRAIKEVRALWRPGSKTPIIQRFYRFGSMNMLMCLGTSIAYFASIAELGLGACGMHVGDSDYYFDSVVFLTMFILIGRFLEAYSKTRTGDAVTALGSLRPDEAILVDTVKMQDQKVGVDLLEVGDVVRVQHGASPPFDGVVMDAAAKFDESSLTGEARPVNKDIGDTVYAGTVNKGGPIQVRLSSISGTSMLDQIIKVVREGQTRRAPVERVADMITGHFVPCVTAVAVTTWTIWLSLGLSGALPEDYRGGDSGSWPLWSLRFAIAVFVVACPCGIGLASPTALFVGGGLAARHGILVKGGGEAFQEASTLDAIVFDKTGTLTQGGDPAVTDVEVLAQGNPEKVYELAARLEEGSGHPIATAIMSYCASRSSQQNFQVTSAEEISGKGMKAEIKVQSSGARIFKAIIGNEALMADHSIAMGSATAAKLDDWKRQGKSVALMGICTSTSETGAEMWTLSVAFAISDPLRPESLPTVTSLQQRGIDVWMLSGDNPTTAHAIGARVGIPPSNIIAGVLPDQKAEKIQYLQKMLPPKGRGKKRATVAMVGDGINDSPALTMADVGVAIGSGSDVAISSADFILVTSRLDAVLTLVDLSRIVFRRVWFNFAWALVYNLAAMPIAAGVLFPAKTASGAHIRLDPVWASLAMALSSFSVVCSSLLLRSKIPGVGFRPKVSSQ